MDRVNILKYVEELGSSAFRKGLQAIPAEDKEFLEYAKKTSTQLMPPISYMLAWDRGWKKGKASIENPPLTEATIESYKKFLSTFKKENPSLVESIQKGFSTIFESFYQDLMDLGDMKSRLDGVNPEQWDTTQCRIFKDEWNKRYPSYPVSIKGNLHDFGTYFNVQIKEELFDKSFEDTITFPDGIEQAATILADELHLDY